MTLDPKVLGSRPVPDSTLFSRENYQFACCSLEASIQEFFLCLSVCLFVGLFLFIIERGDVSQPRKREEGKRSFVSEKKRKRFFFKKKPRGKGLTK